jgi:hypothetical protein
MFENPYLTVPILGLIGGLGNSLLMQGNFAVPRVIKTDGRTSWDPGFLGNMFLGALAALVTYALDPGDKFSVRQVGIAVLSGIGGASILTEWMQRKDIRILEIKNEALSNTIAKRSSAKRKNP